MIDWLLHRQIDDFEQRYDYDMGYAHRMLRACRRAFWRFALFSRLAQYRDGVPPAPYFAARLCATLHEDCGPCTQLVVRMAEEAGVPGATLRALVARDFAALDDATALAARYAEAVLGHRPEAAALHERVRARFGERGVMTLALAIAWTRVFPTLKRGLGAAHACARIEIGGQSVAPRHAMPRA